jgi:predicted phage tail protein
MAEPIRLILIDHPLDNSKRRIEHISPHGQKITTLAKRFMRGEKDLIVRVNQEILSGERLDSYRASAGDEIIMVPAARWGIVQGIGTILTTVTGQATWHAALWAIAVNVAVAVGAGYLISMLGPKPESPKLEGITQSQSFSWQPHTLQAQGLVRPRGYGKVKHHGNLVSCYTVADGEDETIFMIAGLSEGPVEGIVTGSIRINDQPVGNFDNVTTYERRGLMDQAAIQDQARPEYRPNRKMTYDGGAETFTTAANDYDDLEITIEYRLAWLNDSGGYSSSTMGVKIEISEVGLGAWSTLVNTTLTNGDSNPQKKTYTASGSYDGGSPVSIDYGTRYEFRVTKTTADKGARYLDELRIVAVREVIDIPFIRPGLSQVGVEALATEQISGSINISCIQQERIINVFNGTSWNLQYNNNPAWVIWDLLTLPVISGDGDGTPYAIERYDGVNPSRLTPYLNDYYLAAEWFDDMVPDGEGGTEKRIEFNGLFDAGIKVWDAVNEVCRMARCEVVPVGLNYKLIVDKIWSEDPVQLFTAGNIKPGTFRRDYLPFDQRASEIETHFLDADQDYERSPLVLYTSDINNPNNKITLKKIGIAGRSQAWRDAYYELAKNRYIKSAETFDADIDAIVCLKGEVIAVVSPWKKDGRIVSVPATNKVILDREPTVTGSDSLIITSYDKASETTKVKVYTVASVDGAEVTISGSFTYRPAAEDVYAFGPTDKVIEKFRIIGIIEKADLSHTIIAGEYHDEIYTGDDDEPVLPMAGYSSPPVVTDQTRPITLADLRAEYPKEVLGLPNIDAPITTGIVFSS